MARDETLTRILKPQVWSFAGAVAAALLGVVAIASGNLIWATASFALAVGLWLATGALNRRDPIPMPYYIRWLLFLPRGPHSPTHLMELLAPQPGERVLEVGPGPGIHAIPIARALLPAGELDVIDMQRQMLSHLTRRCRRAGVDNIRPSLGSAHILPYADHLFDAAYMITVLGEIPNQQAAMNELRRVIKRDGRLVIGESRIDPDYISLSELLHLGAGTGFDVEEVCGPSVCYLARLRPKPTPEAVLTRSGAHVVSEELDRA